MPDVLSQGGDRAPSPWPRRLAVAAVLAAVVVVAIVRIAGGHGAAPRRGAAPTATSPGVLPGLAGPDGVTGPTFPVAASLRLPVSGERPAWFWPGTGRRQLIGGLPAEPAGYLFTRVSQGWAVQPNPGDQGRCGNCAGQPGPAYFLPDGSGTATRIGTADSAAPAASPGAAWLTSYPPGADTSLTAGTAREVSSAGAALGGPVLLPAGYLVQQGTRGGLLLTPVTPRPGRTADLLWNPATRRTARTFTGVVAAAPAEVAWTRCTARRCRLQVLQLAAGRVTAVSMPAGSSATSGAFSPDGQFLAVEVTVSSGGDGGGLALQLDVSSVATGRLSVVPQTWVSSDALAGFGWPADSDSLVTRLSFTSKEQLAAWQPGAARLAVTALSPGLDSSALVTG